MNDHERAFVDTFIAEDQRERATRLLARRGTSNKARAKLDRWIGSQLEIDSIHATELAPNTTPTELEAVLHRKDAPTQTCWVISNTDSDGESLSNAAALAELFEGAGGLILSRSPGRLALYATEAPHAKQLLLGAACPERQTDR